MAGLSFLPKVRFFDRDRRRSNRARLAVEELEPRHLPSTAAAPFDPQQIAQAYGFNQSSLTGKGQTIAIVDAYNDPNLLKDVAEFDGIFHLPAVNVNGGPTLRVVNQTGGAALPATNASWALEIALDVEWAHALAPGANLLVVEANSGYLDDLLAGVSYAANHASVVSMSWGGGEFSGETSYDYHFDAPHVTFIASSGDSGTVQWPAVSPNVLAVGGTDLIINTSGGYLGETAWNGSGGGVSRYESLPGYQSGIAFDGKRNSPDVAAVADPATGLYLYDSVPYQGYAGWYQMGGTSAAAPQWAALIARADQGRAQAGLAPLGSVQTLDALYGLYHAPTSNTYHYSNTFHDIVAGKNSAGFEAKPGYDDVTGLGSPLANNLIPYLAHYNTASGFTETTTATVTASSSLVKTAATHYHAEAIPLSLPWASTAWLFPAAPLSGSFPISANALSPLLANGLPRMAALPVSDALERRFFVGVAKANHFRENTPVTPPPSEMRFPSWNLPDTTDPAMPSPEITPARLLAEMAAEAMREALDEIHPNDAGQLAPYPMEWAVLAAAFAGLWPVFPSETRRSISASDNRSAVEHR